MKASVWHLIQVHYGTYVDARDDRKRWKDHALFEGLPVLLAAACGAATVKLPSGASIGLLTVSGLLSAFLFGVMLQISDRAMDWADSRPSPGTATSTHAAYLREIAANSGYASLVSITTAALFVVGTVTQGPALVVFTALGLGFALHMALVLLMVIRRVFALTEERLTIARTGANVTQLEHRKTG